MPTFIHHPDGRIYVDGMKISMETFLESEPGYKLPGEAIGLRYDGAEVYYFSNKKEWIVPGPQAELDGYIQKKSQYEAKKKAKDEANKPTEKEWLADQMEADQSFFDALYDLETRLFTLEDPAGTPLTPDEFKVKLFGTKLAKAKAGKKIKAN